jgi:hypothetical protein
VAENNDSRPPRGALAVVGVGLVATIAAALLGNPNLSGEAAQLEWVQFENVADSRPVSIPGGGGEMELAEAGLRSTGTNVSGYTLFRSAATLRIDAGSPVGSARILCAMWAAGDTEVGQTPGSRASYPRSSEELTEQPVPEVVLVEFASHGTGLAVVDVEDMPGFFATEEGIKLEWPTFKPAVERWRWYLPPGPPAADLELPFYSVWRATKPPSIEIACSLTTSAGTVTVRTSGSMSRMPAPIDES